MDRMMSLQSIDYEIDDEYVINKGDLELYNEFESMEVLVPADIDLDDASQKIKFVNEDEGRRRSGCLSCCYCHCALMKQIQRK